MDAAPFRLTFGVELEFITTYNPEEYKNELLVAEEKLWPGELNQTIHRKNGIQVSLRMIQCLNENGFLTNNHKCRDFLEVDGRHR